VHIAGGGKVGEKILYLSQRLRQCLSSSIASTLAACNTSFQLQPGPARPQPATGELPQLLARLRAEVAAGAAPRLSQAELGAKLADIIESQVKYHVRTPPRGAPPCAGPPRARCLHSSTMAPAPRP